MSVTGTHEPRPPKAFRHKANGSIESQPDLRGSTPEELVIRGEELECVRVALRALEPEKRVLILLVMQGYRQAEIAEVISKPLGGIGGRITRALRDLKREIQERIA